MSAADQTYAAELRCVISDLKSENAELRKELEAARAVVEAARRYIGPRPSLAPPTGIELWGALEALDAAKGGG